MKHHDGDYLIIASYLCVEVEPCCHALLVSVDCTYHHVATLFYDTYVCHGVYNLPYRYCDL